MIRKRTDALAVGFDDSRVHRQHRDGCDLVALPAQGFAIGLPRRQGLVDLGEVGGAVGDRSDEALDRRVGFRDSAIDLGQPLAAIGTVRLHLVMVPLHQPRHGVRFEQLVDDAGEDALLQFDALDRAADVAGALLAMTGAADPAAPDYDHRSTAGAAGDKSAEQMARPIAIAEGEHRPGFGCILRGLPQLLVDDAQLGHVDADHVLGRVDSRDPLPALRIALHLDAVVEIATGIDRVAQDADTACPRPVDGGRAPLAPAGRGDALGIQRVGDPLRRYAGDILAVDPLDDRSLRGIHRPQPALQLPIGADPAHHVIAIGQPARYPAAHDSAPLAAPDLVRQILQEHARHRATEADVHFVDVPFAQRVELHTGEFEPLVHRRDVSLVAGEAIQRLAQHDIEGPRSRGAEHSRHAGPPVVRAAEGDVGEDVGDFPAFPLGIGRADCDLVLGRVGVLSVGREACVDGAAWHLRLRLLWSRATSSAAMSRAIASTRAAMAGFIGGQSPHPGASGRSRDGLGPA